MILHSLAWWRQHTVPAMLFLFCPPERTTVLLIPSNLRHLLTVICSCYRKVWHIVQYYL